MPNVCVPFTADSMMNFYAADTNYGSVHNLYIDILYVAGGKTQKSRTLLRTTIPAEVNAAEVYKAFLYMTQGGGTTPPAEITIGRVDNGGDSAYWVEGEVTWNSRKTGTAWASPGGVYVAPTVTWTSSVSYRAGLIVNIDVTDLVTDAITNRSRLFDILMLLTDESGGGVSTQYEFYSRDEGSDAINAYRCPLLVIVRAPFGQAMEV